MADLEKLADELSNLTVMEAADLSKLLEEKWGVTAAAPVAMAAAPAAAGGDAGGEIVGVGTPESIVKIAKSYTGNYLKIRNCIFFEKLQ